MSSNSVSWTLAIHLAAAFAWIANLTAGLALLRAYAALEAGAREALDPQLKRVGIIMDATATFAILAGLGLLHLVKPSPLAQPWMHIKLTVAILGAIGIHVVARVRMRKFRNGNVAMLPAWMPSAPLIIAAIITVLALVKPLAK